MADNYPVEMTGKLLALARKQRELLNHVFDFDTHAVKDYEPRRKFFGRRKLTEYERLWFETEELRDRASSYASFGWWMIPWNEVESVLCYVLHEIKRSDGWRFESELRGFTEGNVRYVISAEHGASQKFMGDSIYQHETVSQYTEQERTERMARYDKSTLNAYLYTQYRADRQNSFIKSSLTDQVYSDVVDYYVSEGWLTDSALRRNYEQKMYTEQYVEGAQARAVSRRRVNGLFTVGVYQTDYSGRLSGFKSLEYQPVSIIPPEYEQVLTQRHESGSAVFKLCEYIAGDDGVRDIPYSLLADIAGNGADRDMLCLQSALITLVAEKLIAA